MFVCFQPCVCVYIPLFMTIEKGKFCHYQVVSNVILKHRFYCLIYFWPGKPMASLPGSFHIDKNRIPVDIWTSLWSKHDNWWWGKQLRTDAARMFVLIGRNTLLFTLVWIYVTKLHFLMRFLKTPLLVINPHLAPDPAAAEGWGVLEIGGKCWSVIQREICYGCLRIKCQCRFFNWTVPNTHTHTHTLACQANSKADWLHRVCLQSDLLKG